MDPIVVREALAEDRPLLDRFLAIAARWQSPDAAQHLEEVLQDDHNVRYVEGWPQDGDFGVVAELVSGRAVGAAWARLLAEDRSGYGFVAPGIPELSIGVEPECRGSGIGTQLLGALIDLGRQRGLHALSLSVERANPAKHLYARVGFVELADAGGSTTMLLRLD